MEKQDIYKEDIDYNVWFLLSQARHALHKARTAELRKYGISPAEAAVLLCVSIVDKPNPMKISLFLLREHNSVSSLLTRMEKAGLIRKKVDTRKRSSVIISLTEKGKKVYLQSIERESIHGIMQHLNDAEKKTLLNLLDRLRKESLKYLALDLLPQFP